MTKFLALILVASIGLSARAVSQPRYLLAQDTDVDRKILIQQQYTADVAGAVFLALRDVFTNALTNQLMAGAVLASYTNSLDAADAAQVVKAVNDYSTAMLGMLDSFLLQEQRLNDDTRTGLMQEFRQQADSVLASVEEVATSATKDLVLQWCNGIMEVDQDFVGGEIVLSNACTAAYDIRDEAGVVIRPAIARTFTSIQGRYASRCLVMGSSPFVPQPADTNLVVFGSSTPAKRWLVQIEQWSSSTFTMTRTPEEELE